jgi:hypothetical protein
MGTCSPGHVSVTGADDADGADANAGFCFGATAPGRVSVTDADDADGAGTIHSQTGSGAYGRGPLMGEGVAVELGSARQMLGAEIMDAIPSR